MILNCKHIIYHRLHAFSGHFAIKESFRPTSGYLPRAAMSLVKRHYAIDMNKIINGITSTTQVLYDSNFKVQSSRPRIMTKVNEGMAKDPIIWYLIAKGALLNNTLDLNKLDLSVKKDLLVQAVVGAYKSKDFDGFISIFDKWWDTIDSCFNELEMNDIKTVVVHLGKINMGSKKKLRKFLTLEHLKTMENKMMQNKEQIHASYYMLYKAYSKLSCPMDFYSTVRLPSNPMISETFKFFKINHYKDRLIFELKLTDIVRRLSTLTILPSPKHILFIVHNYNQFCINNIFGRSSEKSEKRILHIRGFYNLVIIHNDIPRIFIKYRLNPDHILPGFWKFWFKSVKGLLELQNMYNKEEIEQLQMEKGGDRLYSLTNQLLFLCCKCFRVAEKFNKFDELLSMKNAISEVLEKSIPFAMPIALYSLDRNLKSCEMAFKVKLFDETFAQKTSSRRLIFIENGDLILKLAKGAQRYKDYKEKELKDKNKIFFKLF